MNLSQNSAPFVPQLKAGTNSWSVPQGHGARDWRLYPQPHKKVQEHRRARAEFSAEMLIHHPCSSSAEIQVPVTY